MNGASSPAGNTSTRRIKHLESLLASARQSSTSQITSLKADISSQRSQIHALSSQLATSQSHLEAAETEITNLKTAVECKDSYIRDLRDAILKMERSRAVPEAPKTPSDGPIETGVSHSGPSDLANVSLHTSILEGKLAAARIQAIESSLLERIASLESENDTLRREITTAAQAGTSLAPPDDDLPPAESPSRTAPVGQSHLTEVYMDIFRRLRLDDSTLALAPHCLAFRVARSHRHVSALSREFAEARSDAGPDHVRDMLQYALEVRMRGIRFVQQVLRERAERESSWWFIRRYPGNIPTQEED